MANFVLPSGAKIRTQTKSRFVLIAEGDRGPWIEKRSGSVDTLRTHRRREQQNRGRLIGASGVKTFIGDTVTLTVQEA